MSGTDGIDGVGWMVDFAGKERITIQIDLLEDGMTIEQALDLMSYARDTFVASEAAYEADCEKRLASAGSSGHSAQVLRQCAVYRFFDARGRLLYVGKAIDPVARQKQHEKRVWWADVDTLRTVVAWYPSERAALDAEDVAIRDEDPVYNRVGGGRS